MVNETKNLNTKVNTDLYWDFKREAAKRRETIPEAVENALRLYLGLTMSAEVKSDDNNA